jgi:hypothetical protein
MSGSEGPLLLMNKESCVTMFMVQNAMDITTIAYPVGTQNTVDTQAGSDLRNRHKNDSSPTEVCKQTCTAYQTSLMTPARTA